MHHDATAATAAATAARLACRPLPGPDRVLGGCWVAGGKTCQRAGSSEVSWAPSWLQDFQADLSSGPDLTFLASISTCQTGKWVSAALGDLALCIL